MTRQTGTQSSIRAIGKLKTFCSGDKKLTAMLEGIADTETQKTARHDAFVCSVRDISKSECAEAWLRYVADNMDTYGQQEAVVYLAGHGNDCSSYAKMITVLWREAEHSLIQEFRRGSSMAFIGGKNRRQKRIRPSVENPSPENCSSYLLANFWSGVREQQDTIDATMLRTVEGCAIGGFDQWWKRLAKDYRDLVYQAGVRPISACFCIFALCRSGLAISLMNKTLVKLLEGIEIPFVDDRYPWRDLCEVMERKKHTQKLLTHIPCAASIAFSAWRLKELRSDTDETASAALETILRYQRTDGSWPCWENEKDGSIQSTAMAVHALAQNKPRGWHHAVAGAQDWLWSTQNKLGYWCEPACPDATYLTVLVMDALDLIRGHKRTTFNSKSQAEFTASSKHEPRFLVALSFPGEQRPFIQQVADVLAEKHRRDHILYDKYHEAEFARPNLDTHLQRLYHDESKLVVVFLCREYEEKEWCGLEFRAIRDLIKKNRDHAIMLFRFDGTDIHGIFSVDGYINVNHKSPGEIAALIEQRLAATGKKHAANQ